ncbi:MAG: UbiH/UbiF/VisC/COQ6 family ubiquinone biosynthesis hydroxylase [Pseudomonadota bacterium]
MSNPSAFTHDVVIIGGGMIGLTLAHGLAKHGVHTAVVDLAPTPEQVAPNFDGRASAVAYASSQMLKSLGLWDALEEDAQPILEIRVSDGPSLLHLHFDHQTLGDGPLGYLIENRHLRQALHASTGKKDEHKFDLFAPAKAEVVDRGDYRVDVHLESGEALSAPLLIAADGKASKQRQDAGISVTKWMYPQHAIVTTVAHEFSHEGIAHERFMPAGPFAILPLTRNRSNIVWTAKAKETPAIMALDDDAFLAALAMRSGDFLGKIELAAPRWSYPLGFQHAERYVDRRMALVGDAGHVIHPIAGQGLNLGMRDIAALIEVLVDAQRLGQDLGDPEVLARYERWRRADNVMLGVVTDGLNRLFSNDLAPVRLARDVGLAAVDRMPGLGKFFMRHARGTVGELPKLLTGAPV